MVFISYSHRLILDYHFVKWISESGNKSDLIKKMLRININSKEHPRENIVISENDFENLCSEGIIKDKDIIRGCMSSFNLKDKLDGILETGVDLLTLPEELKRLVLGILLTKENPFQVLLITTKEQKQKYYSTYSDFLSKIKKLEIKDEEESLIILNDLFKKYCSEHESCNV